MQSGSHTQDPLIIVASSGTGGDMQPFVTLARGLQARGHRTEMLAPQFHEAMIRRSGLPCTPFGTTEAWQALLDDPDLWHEQKGWGVIWNGLVPHLDALCERLRTLPPGQPCAVLCHPVLVPMAALARAVRPDLRIVAAYLAPANLCSSHDMRTAGSLPVPAWVPLSWRQALWRQVHRIWIDPVTLPALDAARRRHGLPPAGHFFAHMLSAPDASLGLFPDWFAQAQPDWPQPFEQGDFVRPPDDPPAPLSPALSRFLDEGPAPVVFTPGTGHRHAQTFFAAAREAVQGLGLRALFVTPHAAQLPASLPDSILALDHAPFATLLPRTAAIVHHGGIGTLADAFRAGIPQLVIPFAYDQFDNGARVRHAGAGDVLIARRLSARRMQKRLARLLDDPAIRQACARIARQMAAGPASGWLPERAEALLLPGPR